LLALAGGWSLFRDEAGERGRMGADAISESAIQSTVTGAGSGDHAVQRAERVPVERPALAQSSSMPMESAPPFFQGFGGAQQRPMEDNRAVIRVLNAYRERFGGFPAGEENRHIVNALAGNNPKGIAFLDRSTAPLNQQGEMVDRWGSPYFFHFIDREWIEIRSAGPDLEMFTDDDVVAPSHGGAASLQR
jgi:hypothetical protein